jgi:hypothetical protein
VQGMRRIRWTRGQHANVDGIPFAMPVASRDSPALFACYTIDAERARALLPGRELHPFRIWKRGLLLLEVVYYTDTPIGKYVEFCVGIVCTRGTRPAPPLLPAVLAGRYGMGQYIYDLPVSTQISVKGGLGIWGMPKRQANLDFVIEDDWVSSQYDLDGELVVRLDVRRPRSTPLPLSMSGVGYGAFRGMLTKSYVHLKGRAGVNLGQGAARLLIGTHARARPLAELDISPEPLVSGFMPSSRGWLDDHIETWFLTERTPPAAAQDNRREVVDLGLSQSWLAPPDRARSTRLLHAREQRARAPHVTQASNNGKTMHTGAE